MQIYKRRWCEYCGETATWRVTFLLENARWNPASKAYGRDYSGWIQDAETFICDEHCETARLEPPQGMRWCAGFPYDRFPHQFFCWKTVEGSERVPDPALSANRDGQGGPQERRKP